MAPTMLRFGLFDLDDTVYASECGLWTAIGDRIDRYMVQRVGVPAGEVRALRRRYLESFGTALNGLRAEHGIDPQDYLAFVHDLPLTDYLAPSPALRAMLARLPLTKVIFTNADTPHARRVLACLDIEGCFERIIDINALGLINKPDPRAYQRALELLGARAEECVFVDDAPRNLAPAAALGMLTVMVSSAPGQPPAGVAHKITSLLELEQLLRPVLGANGRGSGREAPRH